MVLENDVDKGFYYDVKEHGHCSRIIGNLLGPIKCRQVLKIVRSAVAKNMN